jgi:hypothetical protein
VLNSLGLLCQEQCRTRNSTTCSICLLQITTTPNYQGCCRIETSHACVCGPGVQNSHRIETSHSCVCGPGVQNPHRIETSHSCVCGPGVHNPHEIETSPSCVCGPGVQNPHRIETSHSCVRGPGVQNLREIETSHSCVRGPGVQNPHPHIVGQVCKIPIPILWLHIQLRGAKGRECTAEPSYCENNTTEPSISNLVAYYVAV